MVLVRRVLILTTGAVLPLADVPGLSGAYRAPRYVQAHLLPVLLRTAEATARSSLCGLTAAAAGAALTATFHSLDELMRE
eukprot:COSAG01_NODE_6733_length_3524_cov_2.038832_2_plen_80_part_00